MGVSRFSLLEEAPSPDFSGCGSAASGSDACARRDNNDSGSLECDVRVTFRLKHIHTETRA